MFTSWVYLERRSFGFRSDRYDVLLVELRDVRLRFVVCVQLAANVIGPISFGRKMRSAHTTGFVFATFQRYSLPSGPVKMR